MVNVDGLQVEAAFAHAPSNIKIEARIEKPLLVFHYGLDARAFDFSDGVRFIVRVKQRGGHSEELMSLDCSPRDKSDDRNWKYASLDVSKFVGETVSLEFVTEPKENAGYDWALWVDPRFIE
jgi:hypothetical protein